MKSEACSRAKSRLQCAIKSMRSSVASCRQLGMRVRFMGLATVQEVVNCRAPVRFARWVAPGFGKESICR
jgi:hypothetical protein